VIPGSVAAVIVVPTIDSVEEAQDALGANPGQAARIREVAGQAGPAADNR